MITTSCGKNIYLPLLVLLGVVIYILMYKSYFLNTGYGAVHISGDQRQSPLKNLSRENDVRHGTISGRGGLHTNLPDVIGLGVKKCGTRTLHTFIDKHPNITSKLTFEFLAKDQLFHDKGTSYYRSLWHGLTDDVIVEESSTYLFETSVIKRIRRIYGTALSRLKFSIILCNPVDRLYSEYVHALSLAKTHPERVAISNYNSVSHYINEVVPRVEKKLKEISLLPESVSHESFDDFLKKNPEIWPLARGMYAFYIKRWRNQFSLNKMLIVNGEQLIKKPWEVLGEVYSILGVDIVHQKENFSFNKKKGFYCLGRCMGSGKGRTRGNGTVVNKKYSPPTRNDREVLQSFYSVTAGNNELINIFGKDWTFE